ncbi:lysophospholipase [Spongiibacter taiwanensis]|uniref:alpha/beta hydrolase n=1 Tax=Spongiibacter taiwanensis TaxID=1748242 RepID=UPI002035C57D|nr:alpha/beta hydrolase [Spongiibacter taiwanensis]USA42325.1 lysophospholipase [Spongiibacter taiwanensis]
MFSATSGHIDSKQGGKRYWQSWPAPQARAALVVVHGLAEHSGRYGRLASCLHALNVSTFALDHRGHGRSDGKPGAIGQFEHLTDDLAHFIGEVVTPLGLPLFLFGKNIGGTLAIDYLLQQRCEATGLILSAPFIHADFLPPDLALVLDGLSTFLPNLPGYKLSPSLLTQDRQELQQYREDKLILRDAVPVKSIAEILGAMAGLREHLQSITTPLLLLQGLADPLVGAESSQQLHATWRAADKTYLTYPDLRHDLLNEHREGRAAVTKAICDWLATRLPDAS